MYCRGTSLKTEEIEVSLGGSREPGIAPAKQRVQPKCCFREIKLLVCIVDGIEEAAEKMRSSDLGSG